MKYVFSHWAEIVARIRKSPGLFIALDYDGVLSPIALTPGKAHMPPKNRRLLKALACRKNVSVAIVSGRSLTDIQQKVRLSQLIYAGNHGAEIALDGSVEKHIPLQMYREALVKALAELIVLGEKFPGVHVEDKGFGIGFHYREVSKAKIAAVKRAFKQWTKQLSPNLKIALAKMMFEVRPNFEWNKGSAVLRIWQQIAPKALPICLGDDTTDEDGFIALKGKGINVFVGVGRPSNAEYFLESTDDVSSFLNRLLTEAKRRYQKGCE